MNTLTDEIQAVVRAGFNVTFTESDPLGESTDVDLILCYVQPALARKVEWVDTAARYDDLAEVLANLVFRAETDLMSANRKAGL